MDVQAAIQFFANEGRVILEAPATFGIAATALMIGAWAISRYAYASRLESLEGRLKLRDDQIADYKEKLSGATPEEAKERIEALELKVQALSPHRLDPNERAKLTKALAGTKGLINIQQDMAAADAKALTADLNSAFQAAGWRVELPMVVGISNSPPSGLGLTVIDPNNLRPIEQAVRSALIAAGLTFDVRPGLARHLNRPQWPAGFTDIAVPPDPDVEIIVTTRAS